MPKLTPQTDYRVDGNVEQEPKQTWEEMLDKLDYHIMNWFYEIVEINFNVEMVQDSSDLRAILEEHLDYIKNNFIPKEEVREIVNKLIKAQQTKDCKLLDEVTDFLKLNKI